MCDFFGMDASNFRSQVGFDVRTLDSVQEMSQESIRYQLLPWRVILFCLFLDFFSCGNLKNRFPR